MYTIQNPVAVYNYSEEPSCIKMFPSVNPMWNRSIIVVDYNVSSIKSNKLICHRIMSMTIL